MFVYCLYTERYFCLLYSEIKSCIALVRILRSKMFPPLPCQREKQHLQILDSRTHKHTWYIMYLIETKMYWPIACDKSFRQ